MDPSCFLISLTSLTRTIPAGNSLYKYKNSVHIYEKNKESTEDRTNSKCVATEIRR